MTVKPRPAPSGKTSPGTAEADLAFLRRIVEGGSGRGQIPMGVLFLAGGLLYGFQCLFHLGQAAGIVRIPDWASLIFVVSVTLVMLAVVAWAVHYGRKFGLKSSAGPTVSRAMDGAFSATGAANLAIIVVFGVGAARDNDFAIWLYYPAIVFAFQSIAWFVAWTLKRKPWMGMVALGHWSTAVALGLLVRDPIAYTWVCAAALFLLFALPGWIILREARAAQAAA